MTEKLEAEADAVRAEGWKWVAVRPSFEYSEWSDYGRRHKEPVPVSPEQEAEFNLLVLEQEKLSDLDGYSLSSPGLSIGFGLWNEPRVPLNMLLRALLRR